MNDLDLIGLDILEHAESELLDWQDIRRFVQKKWRCSFDLVDQACNQLVFIGVIFAFKNRIKLRQFSPDSRYFTDSVQHNYNYQ